MHYSIWVGLSLVGKELNTLFKSKSRRVKNGTVYSFFFCVGGESYFNTLLVDISFVYRNKAANLELLRIY